MCPSTPRGFSSKATCCEHGTRPLRGSATLRLRSDGAVLSVHREKLPRERVSVHPALALGRMSVRGSPRTFFWGICGCGVHSWGAWIRTKIHRSKVWCAALAPRPNFLRGNCIMRRGQRSAFSDDRKNGTQTSGSAPSAGERGWTRKKNCTKCVVARMLEWAESGRGRRESAATRQRAQHAVPLRRDCAGMSRIRRIYTDCSLGKRNPCDSV